MPYSGPDDKNLPKAVRTLPPDKKKQWVGAWNGAYKQCISQGGKPETCEAQAFKVANGSLQKQESVIFEATLRAPEGQGPEGCVWDVVLIGASTEQPPITIEGREYIWSRNRRLYSCDALRESVAKWDGVKVYDNHLTDAEFQERGGMRSVAREWVGTIVDPRWDGEARALRGTLKIVDESLARKLKAAHEAGVLDTVGLSIDTAPTWTEVTHEGESLPVVAGFDAIYSVDVVAEPAAGGGFARLIAATDMSKRGDDVMKIESKEQLQELLQDENVKGWMAELAAVEAEEVDEDAEPENESEQADEEPAPEAENEDTEPEPEPENEADKAVKAMARKLEYLECRLMLRDKLDAAKLSAPMRKTVETAFGGRVFDEKELDTVIARAKEAEAAADKTGRVVGAGAQRNETRVTFDEQDKAEAAFARMILGRTAFREIESNENATVKERVPEAYTSWIRAGRPDEGPVRLSEWARMLCGGDPLFDSRAREALVTTSSMTSIIKNTLNLKLAADYAQRTEWWAPIVSTEEVDNIDDATLVRIFGMDTLAVVSEGQPYTELGWDDEEETASFVKRGNFVGVTLETIMSDKINAIRRIPDRLSRSWYNTLSNMVSAVFTTNSAAGPVLADSGALFNNTAVTSSGGHANLLTTALSYTALTAAELAMMKQTDQPLGTGEKLLIRPKYLLVPVDLEGTADLLADNEFRPESSDRDRNKFQGRIEPIVVPTWTDTNNWALVADPREFPAIWLIFPRGNRVPSLFTADNDSAGAMFTNDTMRFKVRMLTYRYSSTYDCAPVGDWRPLHKSNVS